MIKKLPFISVLICAYTYGQLVVSPSNFGVNSGTITITYGSSGDYSLFNPNFDENLYLYTGLETDGVSNTWDYHDTWTDLATLIPLTYNSSLGYYVATFNIGTRVYTQDSSNIQMQIPSGTYVNNWYFIIRNASGTSQSVDLIGTNFGFQPALGNSSFNSAMNNIYVVEDRIISNLNTNLSIEIFTIDGKCVYKFILNPMEEKRLNLINKGVYLAILKEDEHYKSIKFVY